MENQILITVTSPQDFSRPRFRRSLKQLITAYGKDCIKLRLQFAATESETTYYNNLFRRIKSSIYAEVKQLHLFNVVDCPELSLF